MKYILRYTLICAAAILVVILAVVFTGGADHSKEIQTATQTAQYNEGYMYRNDFTFTGDQTEIIEVRRGMIKFNLSYPGSSRFSATLINPDGTMNKVITNAAGPYNRFISIDVEQQGLYTLDVKTTGKWSLSQD